MSVGDDRGRATATDDHPIPAHVRRLLDRRLSSVSELETLLLLVRSRRRWTVPGVARHFVLAEEHTALLLGTLVKAGLVRRTGAEYEFDPVEEKDRDAAETLAGLYGRYRTRIMRLLLASPGDETTSPGDD